MRKPQRTPENPRILQPLETGGKECSVCKLKYAEEFFAILRNGRVSLCNDCKYIYSLTKSVPADQPVKVFTVKRASYVPTEIHGRIYNVYTVEEVSL